MYTRSSDSVDLCGLVVIQYLAITKLVWQTINHCTESRECLEVQLYNIKTSFARQRRVAGKC